MLASLLVVLPPESTNPHGQWCFPHVGICRECLVKGWCDPGHRRRCVYLQRVAMSYTQRKVRGSDKDKNVHQRFTLALLLNYKQFLFSSFRYDIRIYPTFLHLHGKTFDYKIPYTTVLRLFLLPHKDQRQMFFVVSHLCKCYIVDNVFDIVSFVSH